MKKHGDILLDSERKIMIINVGDVQIDKAFKGVRILSQQKQGKDTFDCLLCSTVMYEIERAKMSCSARIRDNNEKALEEKINQQKEGK